MGKLDNSQTLDLNRDLQEATQDIASLNRETAAQIILMASQKDDSSSLIAAVNSLRAAQRTYVAQSTPRENAEVQQALADALYTHGRRNNDVSALEHAIDSYRAAITLASLIGDDHLRMELKHNYNLARNLLGLRSSRGALSGAA